MLERPYQEIVDHIKGKVIGQPRAIEQVARVLKIAQANLSPSDRPLGVLMFAGPTGTGKSETVRALAEAIHDDPNKLCRIDCNLLTESHTAASLSGSPPGYVGSVEGNTVLDKAVVEGEAGKPGILVLEEIEKAHPAVWDTLLGIFDKGVLYKNNGTGKINFANTIIIMTSNVGARELAETANGARLGFNAISGQTGTMQLSGSQRRKTVFREMERCFKPEFINRIDYTVVFRWLDQKDQMLIASKFVDDLSDRIFYEFQHALFKDDAALRFLVEKGFDLANGARSMQRAVRKYLEDPLADILLDGKLPYRRTNIQATYRSGDMKLSFIYGDVPLIDVGRHRPTAQTQAITAIGSNVSDPAHASEEEREEDPAA